MQDVVVIGGGLCGLALAHSLYARKLNWTLYEARERLGGRVLTAQCTTGNARLDLGPTWFWPDSQPRITRLVADLGLPTVAQHDNDTALNYDDVNAAAKPITTDRLHGGGQRLVGGMAALIEALQARLPQPRLVTGHELINVTDCGDHVELEFKAGDQVISVSARQVVIAMPPRLVDERIGFVPDLDPSVHEAMRSVSTWMATAAKAVSAYPTAFWREAGHSGNAFVSHHQAVLAEVFDACGPDGQPAALAGFYALDPAQRQSFKASLELLTRNQLMQLFGAGGDDGEMSVHDWARDPYTCSQLDLQDPATEHPVYGDARLTQPLWAGRLWLAGSETAAAAGGYLEGALAAAGRVRQALDAHLAQHPVATQAQVHLVPKVVADPNASSLERFGSWVVGERSQALERYKQRLHRELSQQRVDQLTQRSVLDVVESLYREALTQLAALPFERQGLPVEKGRSALTPDVLEPFNGFTDALLADAVQFNRTSCALSNFPYEAKPAWDYVNAMRRDLAAAWREFALAANELMLAEGATTSA